MGPADQPGPSTGGPRKPLAGCKWTSGMKTSRFARILAPRRRTSPFKAALAAGALTLALTLAPAQAQQARLPGEARPVRQAIFLKADPDQADYEGHTEIVIDIPKATSRITFHAKEMTLTGVALTGKRNFTLTPKTSEHSMMVAHSPTPIPAGRYTLKIDFRAPFNTHSVGLYKFKNDDLNYLSTQFEMTDARRCFPCFDEPGYKIPFQMTVEAPKAARVFNNAPEVKTTPNGDALIHTFSQTPPMPPYLVAVAVGPYESAEITGMRVPGRVVTTKGKQALTEFARVNTPRYVAALEEYFGIPYAYHKLDELGITEFPFGAMENAGMITFREDILLVNPRTASPDIRAMSAAVISHELAHQWFGNLVTMKWWDDLWLNEAFATWMSLKITTKLHPDYEMELYIPQVRVMGADANLTTKPIRKPIKNETDIMDGLGLAYNKGCSALNMVERWLGPDIFRKGINTYLREHRFANAEAADLWNTLSRVSNKDVGTVLKGFTDQSGFPLVTFSPQGDTLTFSQRRFTHAGVRPPEALWTFPLFIKYGAGDRVAHKTVLFNSQQQSVKLDFEPDWVYPDDGAVGYFLWSVPKDYLQRLLNALPRLSSREKLVLVNDINGITDAGVLDVGSQLRAMMPFLDDPHPAVVAEALDTISGVGSLFVDEHNRIAYQNTVRPLVERLVDRYGLDPKPGEHPKVSELRPQLIYMLWHDLDDPSILALARAQADHYLDQSAPVEPTLAETYLLIAARTGDAQLLQRVQKALAEATDPQRRSTLLQALGSFAQPQVHRQALDLMLSDLVTPSDLRTLLRANSSEEYRRRHLQEWLEHHFTELAKKMPSAFLAHIVASMSGARDQEQLASITAFFNSQPDPNGVIQRELSKLQERVQARIATIKRGQSAFDKALKGSSAGQGAK